MARAQAIVIVPNIRERAFQQKVLGSAQLAIFSCHGINPIWTVSPDASPIPGEDFCLKHCLLNRANRGDERQLIADPRTGHTHHSGHSPGRLQRHKADDLAIRTFLDMHTA